MHMRAIVKIAILFPIMGVIGCLGMFNTASSSAATQLVTTPESIITVTLWDWWAWGNITLLKGIADFEKANPGIKISHLSQGYNDYVKLLTQAFQQNAAPDVFLTPQENQLPFSTQMANGWYAPLNEMPDFTKWKAQYPPTAFVKGLNVINGKVYSVPFFKILPTLQLYVNLDLYKEAGLTNTDGTYKLPKTWDDVIANSKVIKDATGKYGWGFGNNVADWNFYLCTFSGGYIVDGRPGWDPKTGKFIFSTRPCFKQILQGLVSMKNENLLLPESTSITDEEARVRFADGEFAHLVGGTWLMNTWRTTNPNFREYDYIAIPLPLVGTDTLQSYWYSGLEDSRLWAISADSTHKEAAWKFFQYLNSPEFAAMWAQDGNGFAYLLSRPRVCVTCANNALDAVYNMGNLVRVGPVAAMHNLDATKVQISLKGASINDVVLNIITGQNTDLDAALKDLDDRSQAAFEKGIQEAQDSGANVTLDDFIFNDWNPLEDYIPHK